MFIGRRRKTDFWRIVSDINDLASDAEPFCVEYGGVSRYDYSMQMDKHKEEPIKPDQQPPEIKAAIDYGIDIQQLMDNLKRTPAERIRRHQMALNAVEKLRKAKRKK